MVAVVQAAIHLVAELAGSATFSKHSLAEEDPHSAAAVSAAQAALRVVKTSRR